MKHLSLEAENEGLKQLLKNGIIYINYWSTDCDGCSAANNTSFQDMESLEKWIKNSYENDEGAWGWDYATKDTLIEEDPRGYWGM